MTSDLPMGLSDITAKNHALLQDLCQLESVLQDQDAHSALVTMDFPNKSPVSFLDYLSNSQFAHPGISSEASSKSMNSATGNPNDLGTEIFRLMEQAKLCCQAPTTPIISVLGLLNAGKSSLVATFLSNNNRQRILVGSGNAQGTHRFVLWIPEDWRTDPVVWSFLWTRLSSIFGCEPEMLSDQPEIAASQYNDTRSREYVDAHGVQRHRPSIQIPLVGFDPELSRWGLALMDCPDVQTGILEDTLDQPLPAGSNATLYHERSQSIADTRLEVLTRASELCSAFVIVLPANAMHDQTVSRLMRVLQQRMPNVDQMLAVNRVPRKYTSREIHQELSSLYEQMPIQRHYMAYGFDGPQLRERLPNPPSDFHESVDFPLPLFFRIDKAPIPQPPKPIDDTSWLLHLGSQLNKQNLVQDVLDSTVLQLRIRVQEGLMFCEARARQSQLATQETRNTIANACLDFSSEGSAARESSVRLQASRQIVQQISKSLERTAPWWAMPGRWTTRMAETGKSTIAKSTSWLQLPTWFSGKTASIGRWIQSRWTTGQSGKIVTAETLVHYLQRHDLAGNLGLDDQGSDSSDSKFSSVKRVCQIAIERFQSESQIELNDQVLDTVTARMWKEMPFGKRLITGFAPAGILFAPLIAVMMVPLDFGGSAVLVFASLKELLFAGVAGVGLVLASADSMPKIAESEVAWQQLGDLYAVLCDELGIERSQGAELPTVSMGSTRRMLPNSHIAIQIRTVPSTMPPIVPLQFSISTSAKEKIKQLLNRLTQVR